MLERYVTWDTDTVNHFFLSSTLGLTTANNMRPSD